MSAFDPKPTFGDCSANRGISAVLGFDDKVRDRNFSVSNVVVNLTSAQPFTGFV